MRSMKSLVWAFCCAVGTSVVSGLVIVAETLAQVIPDDTLGSESSIVVPFNETISEISGGAIREQNLFHSFEEFSIDEGGRVAFVADPAVVENIFARVTGSEESVILGALGTAQITSSGRRVPPAGVDLYLINPNGIIFGENSILAVGGSFTASTANSVQFGTEVFSATNPEIPASALTIDPSAYLFSQTAPANIESYSTANGFLGGGFLGLRVPNRENLTLIGGDITVSGGNNLAGLHAFGGRVELASVGEPGSVSIGSMGEIVASETVPDGNVLLTDRAQINVSFDRDGDINIISGDIDISNASLLDAGISEGLGFEGSQAGNIVLNAARKVTVESSSRIENDVDPSSVGDAGEITINSNTLEVRSGSQVSSSTYGEGNAGSVVISSRESVVFDGLSTNGQNISSTLSTVEAGAIGDGGDIEVFANTLEIRNGARLSASTYGRGDAGNVLIDVEDDVLFIGTSFDDPDLARSDDTTQWFSAAGSSVQAGASGEGGNLIIEANNVTVADGARLLANTSSNVFKGNSAGSIFIVADNQVLFTGTSADGQYVSSALSTVEAGAIGDGGDIEVFANTLEIRNGARLSASTYGRGDAGNVLIDVEDDVLFIGTSFDDPDLARSDDTTQWFSAAGSSVQAGASGEGGNLIIEANNVTVADGARLLANTSSNVFKGNSAGSIFIVADNQVLFTGTSADGQYVSSAFSSVESGGIGDGGNVEITTDTLEVSNGAQLTSSTSGEGDAGNVVITAAEGIVFDYGDAFSSVGPGGIGDGGNVEITTNTLEAFNGAQLVASTSGEGNAGNVIITAEGSIVFSGVSADGQFPSAAFSSVESGGIGDGGNVEIATDNTLAVLNGALLSARSSGMEDAGSVILSSQEGILMRNGTIETSSEFSSGGAVEINTGFAILESDSSIITLVSNGSGEGGDITIAGDFIIALEDSDILASADTSADGSRGGDINFNVRGFFGENFTTDSLTADPNTLNGNERADINATGTTNGVVTLPDVSFVENSLSDLSDDIVTPDQILIASCISRTTEDQGTFNITGGDGLSTSPNSDVISTYPTSDIQSSEATAQTQWRLGDPIDEATGIYELSDGRFTLSQNCS